MERIDSAPEPVVAAPPAAKPAPVIPNFQSAAEIASALESNSVPPEAAPWVRSALATIRPLETRIQAAENEYTQAKERFLKIAAELEGQGAQGSQVMAGKFSEVVDNLESTTSQLVEMSVKLFNNKYPEFDKLPAGSPVRELVYKMWADGTADRAFTGDYFSKMEQVYKFAQFQAGGQAPVAKAVAKPDPAAPQQALINDGQQGTQRPVRNVDEVSMDELLAQHDYLL